MKNVGRRINDSLFMGKAFITRPRTVVQAAGNRRSLNYCSEVKAVVTTQNVQCSRLNDHATVHYGSFVRFT